MVNPFNFAKSRKKARNKGELLQICQENPQEAAEYLNRGDFANWLLYIGEKDLAAKAKKAQKMSGLLPEKLKFFLSIEQDEPTDEPIIETSSEEPILEKSDEPIDETLIQEPIQKLVKSSHYRRDRYKIIFLPSIKDTKRRQLGEQTIYVSYDQLSSQIKRINQTGGKILKIE